MGDNMHKKFLDKDLRKNKYKYLFLITIVIIGIISGIIFSNILSYNDKQEVTNILKDYFINLKDNQDINYLNNFFNILGSNFIYLILMFIFGISIIGIIFNIFVLYFKSFIIGFSMGSIILTYSFKGILGAFLYIFPHIIINLVIYVLICFYGINLSIKLFKALFLKKQFNWNEVMKKYFKIFVLSTITLLITTIYETFLANFVMKLFTFLIK